MMAASPVLAKTKAGRVLLLGLSLFILLMCVLLAALCINPAFGPPRRESCSDPSAQAALCRVSSYTANLTSNLVAGKADPGIQSIQDVMDRNKRSGDKRDKICTFPGLNKVIETLYPRVPSNRVRPRINAASPDRTRASPDRTRCRRRECPSV